MAGSSNSISAMHRPTRHVKQVQKPVQHTILGQSRLLGFFSFFFKNWLLGFTRRQNEAKAIQCKKVNAEKQNIQKEIRNAFTKLYKRIVFFFLFSKLHAPIYMLFELQ